jgi:hypothetical protein
LESLRRWKTKWGGCIENWSKTIFIKHERVHINKLISQSADFSFIVYWKETACTFDLSQAYLQPFTININSYRDRLLDRKSWVTQLRTHCIVNDISVQWRVSDLISGVSELLTGCGSALVPSRSGWKNLAYNLQIVLWATLTSYGWPYGPLALKSMIQNDRINLRIIALVGYCLGSHSIRVPSLASVRR